MLAIVKGKGDSLFAKTTGDSYNQFLAARGSIPDTDKDGSMPKNSEQENTNGTDSESVESSPKAVPDQWNKVCRGTMSHNINSLLFCDFVFTHHLEYSKERKKSLCA